MEVMLTSDAFVVKSRFIDYEVLFVSDFIVPLTQYAVNDTIFIVDRKIFGLYKSQFESVLTDEKVILIDALETNKNIDYCQVIITRLIKSEIKRNYTIVAIGGGIIQDISAFIASILYRGVIWVFFPTTLLSQADSCIGSKTSINMGEYKNLLGNFYPPSKIYIDIDFLETLSVEEIKSGIGEILHFYFFAGSDLAEEMMNNYDEILETPSLLQKYIVASLKIKREIIVIDEFDKNERNLFNYGHTFGHAIETLTRYGINHGQAVTMGMDIANYLSEKLGYMDRKTYDSMKIILSKNIPELDIGKYDLEKYFYALSRDKKNVGENLVCILSQGPGKLVKKQIAFDNVLKEMITSYFSNTHCT